MDAPSRPAFDRPDAVRCVSAAKFSPLPNAVALVRSAGWKDKLSAASAKADARVPASDGFRTVRPALWTYPAPRVAAGASDSQTLSVSVAKTISHLGDAVPTRLPKLLK